MTEPFPTYRPPANADPEPRPDTAAVGADPRTEPAPAGWLLWPARIVALGVVLPIRLAWEALCAAARAVGRVLVAVLRPIGMLVLVPFA